MVVGNLQRHHLRRGSRFQYLRYFGALPADFGGTGVEPGGDRFWVVILDDAAESYRVTAVHGPYESRQS